MDKERHTRVCPASKAGSLDNSFRRLFHNPGRILKPHLVKGMTVLDLGCGPGFFSIEIAKTIAPTGKVIAADLQEIMLEKVKKKIIGTEFEKIFDLHKCQENKIGVTEKVDFVLVFWMIHEVPDKESLLAELKSILKPGGKIYIIEPKFHVSKGAFEDMVNIIRNTGFDIIARPRILFSRAVLLHLNS